MTANSGRRNTVTLLLQRGVLERGLRESEARRLTKAWRLAGPWPEDEEDLVLGPSECLAFRLDRCSVRALILATNDPIRGAETDESARARAALSPLTDALRAFLSLGQMFPPCVGFEGPDVPFVQLPDKVPDGWLRFGVSPAFMTEWTCLKNRCADETEAIAAFPIAEQLGLGAKVTIVAPWEAPVVELIAANAALWLAALSDAGGPIWKWDEHDETDDDKERYETVSRETARDGVHTVWGEEWQDLLKFTAS